MVAQGYAAPDMFFGDGSAPSAESCGVEGVDHALSQHELREFEGTFHTCATFGAVELLSSPLPR